MAGRTGAARLRAALIDGKRKRKYVYAKSEAEAVRKRDELRRQLQLGIDLTAQPRTVKAWLTEWLRDVKAHDGTRPPRWLATAWRSASTWRRGGGGWSSTG
ncbi:hypothetical protein [Salinispora arenicola]|uniref:Uncharacterized protein n=1 Tax=Salinispora arenicola TaxID=168697 RepID=A0A542XKB3_SALAC|nr:hypothetical protein [Salinispora arenicola]MCN0154313.1 hypothetical protein [Salinispora arenicola]TQL36200.1 hypothetical protein FB564_1284 [Salinispora arenicola]GIM83865.1 hypothetical protein Sar04_14390 [Salinispora arenicola]